MAKYDTSPSLLRTPPRPPRRRVCSLSCGSPSMTPTRKTPFSARKSNSMKPKMSPARSLIRTPPSYKLTPDSYSGDRFIPSRRQMNIDLCRRAILSDEFQDENKDGNNGCSHDDEHSPKQPADTPIQKEYKRQMLSSLCNIPLDVLTENSEPKGLLSFFVEEKRKASSSISIRFEDPYSHDTLHVLDKFHNASDSAVIKGSESVNRRIPSQPSRILDAPDLVDDYYLNLISWSKDNILAVALAHCVYLWNASTGDIHHLTTIEGNDDYVTSVQWCPMSGQSKYIAIGTNSNTVQLWDCQSMKKVRTLHGHSGRVASIAWNQHWLTSGGRDSLILQHDVRSANHLVAQYKGHEQEVCGLKWNEDGMTLASGGNENYLCIWDAKMSSSQAQRRGRRSQDIAPRLLLQQHKAAVKALDWCPFHRGLLASGGGTADRNIKLWNSNSGAMLNSIDTGSQVCSILWSPHQRELCSSHGFSENQLILWKYGNGSNLTKVKELTGHTSRVLSLACSPDGSTVVSAAGDESLRFWDIFGAPPSRRSSVMPMGEMSFGMPTVR